MRGVLVAMLIGSIPLGAQAQEPWWGTEHEPMVEPGYEAAYSNEPPAALTVPPPAEAVPALPPPPDALEVPRSDRQFAFTDFGISRRAPVEPGRLPPRRDDDGDGHIAAELGLGAIGYALGTAAGLGIMIASIDEGDGAGLIFGIPAGVLVAGVGLAAGVTLGGEASGGNGTFASAFWGQALGGLASLVLLLATAQTAPELALAGVIALPLAGGVLGYSNSDAGR